MQSMQQMISFPDFYIQPEAVVPVYVWNCIADCSQL
jgi:hypothetical protein